ncbi:MAG: tetratricopeptide repeat protein [Deltaproteobacteria bacterium]|jgi:tetratricopeptide (TPR) repeat protein|nr:tetratricopeptide repeat protein [Deltaproteobacteria bacterium]
MAKQIKIKKLLRGDDAFLTTSEKAYNFFLTHTRYFVWGAVALILVVGVVLIVAQVRASGLKKAAEASGTAIALEDSGGAQSISALSEVIEEHPSSPSARAATLALVRALAASKNYALAAETLEGFVDSLRPGENSLKALALISLGQLYEELNDLSKASNNYRAALALVQKDGQASPSEAPMQSELTQAVGRVLLASGQIEASKKVYEAQRLLYPNRASFQDYLVQYRLAGLTAPSVPAVPTAAGDSPASPSTDNAPTAAGDSPASLPTDNASAVAATDNASAVAAADNSTAAADNATVAADNSTAAAGAAISPAAAKEAADPKSQPKAKASQPKPKAKPKAKAKSGNRAKK